MKVFLNGNILTEGEAVISVLDHGFLYGYGLFETLRTYRGQPFLMKEHYDRLKASAALYQIRMNKTLRELENDIERTILANGLSEAYIRITLSGGEKGLGLWGEEHDDPNWVIMAKPLGKLPPTKSLVVLALARSTPEGPFRTKSTSFSNNMLAKKELASRGIAQAEGIFLDKEGFVAEGTVSNLFFVKQGKVHTPHEKTGLLPGVTRDFVIQLCKQNGWVVEEGFYRVHELEQAEEVFLCNSVQEIVAVDRVNQVLLPKVGGAVTQTLQKQYRKATQ